MKVNDCGSDLIDFHELTEFQGNFKIRTDLDINEIKSKIMEYGFSFPMFVWECEGKKYVIDGHGRLEALKSLEEDGHSIPPVPVVYVKATDTKEAIRILLLCNTRFGYITDTSADNFMDGIDYKGMLENLSLDELIMSPEEVPTVYPAGDIICPKCGTVHIVYEAQ
ncbi:MAG: ParB N-terminal domain-containing protein [Treponema sp.]|nr:ParB N-terminal domain-containing protein [Treponema sp.]